MFNGDRKPIGRCSICGGVVSVPRCWHSVNRPVPSCESCGAVMDVAAGLPEVPMTPAGGTHQHVNRRPLARRGFGGRGLNPSWEAARHEMTARVLREFGAN